MESSVPLLPEGGPLTKSGHSAIPSTLLEETREWEPYADLDVFFSRLYKYWQEKGLSVIVATRLLSLAALAFTIAVCGFLLLWLNWEGLKEPCLQNATCTIAEKAIYTQPLRHGSTLGKVFKLAFLLIFAMYWLYSAAIASHEVRHFRVLQQFCRNKMGVSDTQLSCMPWPELLHRVVRLQRTVKLSLRGELSEHDIVMRIMRKDDFLIGMLNQGVLNLHVPLPLLRRRPLLTTAVTWALRFCLLDAMFDERHEISSRFLYSGAAAARRFRRLAIAAALLLPFVLVFLILHFFLNHLERVYNHPSSLSKRRWSKYAYWRMREFGELPHFVEQRLHSAAKAAAAYCCQFPAPLAGAVASFTTYVTASLAALAIAVIMTHDYLAEQPVAFGHTLVWWLASSVIVLTVTRSMMDDDAPAYNPEGAMAKVCVHTHWVPLYWRARAHTAEVRTEFQALFQFQLVLALEELASVVLLPWLLWVSLPRSADDVAAFLRNCTVYQPGAGHVCSMAAFDLGRHGNRRYGATTSAADRRMRTRQGKLEKSLLSFAASYPTWQPVDPAVGEFVSQFEAAAGAGLVGAASAAGTAFVPPDKGMLAPNNTEGARRDAHVAGHRLSGARDMRCPPTSVPVPVAWHVPEAAPAFTGRLPASAGVPFLPSGNGSGRSAGYAQLQSSSASAHRVIGATVELQRVGSDSTRSAVSSTGAALGGFRSMHSTTSSAAAPSAADGAVATVSTPPSPLVERRCGSSRVPEAAATSALPSTSTGGLAVASGEAVQSLRDTQGSVAAAELHASVGKPLRYAASWYHDGLRPGAFLGVPRQGGWQTSGSASTLLGASNGAVPSWQGASVGGESDVFRSDWQRQMLLQSVLQDFYAASLPPEQQVRLRGSTSSYNTAASQLAESMRVGDNLLHMHVRT